MTPEQVAKTYCVIGAAFLISAGVRLASKTKSGESRWARIKTEAAKSEFFTEATAGKAIMCVVLCIALLWPLYLVDVLSKLARKP